MMQKSKRGGKRPGSGQPKKYIQEMKNLTLRVPECEHPALKETERKIREKYLKKPITN